MYYFYKSLFIAILAICSEYKLINTIPAKAQLVDTDHLEQLYVYENNILKKYDRNGELLCLYSNQLNGDISAIDASDPYIFLAFYKDLNRIIFLDNQLAQIGKPLEFDQINLFNVSVVCKSKNFAVWLYNHFDNQLIHYGFNPKGITQKINLDPLELEQEVVFMRESGSYLYINTGKNMFIFDHYGSFIKKIEIEIENTFQINNKQIIYFTHNKILKQHINEPTTDTLKIDFIQNITHALIENKRLYIQKTDSIYFYDKNH